MKAVIKLDIPDYQIGQEVSVYFKDTMCIKGVCQEDSTIEELEKVKAEITEWCNGYFQEEIGKDINKIINEHIAELKGENNG